MVNVLKLFGKRLRKLRKDKGLTQEELADLAGLHPTFIGAVERGVKNPSLKSISKIAEALEIDLRDFFPPRIAGKSDQAVADILDLTRERNEGELQLAKKVLEDVLSWTRKE